MPNIMFNIQSFRQFLKHMHWPVHHFLEVFASPFAEPYISLAVRVSARDQPTKTTEGVTPSLSE